MKRQPPRHCAAHRRWLGTSLSSTRPHPPPRVRGNRPRAVRPPAVSCCSGAICARSRSSARISFAPRRRRRSRASAMRVATTKSCASAVSTARSAPGPRRRGPILRSDSPGAGMELGRCKVAVEQGRSMSQNARALALMDVAISDASVSVFDTKYSYDFWRPETAIHASGDTTWQPYIVTPCFPSYASAHGSLSNAARKVLERLYGPRHRLHHLEQPGG